MKLYRRILAALLATVLIFSMDILPAVGAEAAEADGPRIPETGSVMDYNAERDGYYAFLPIRYNKVLDVWSDDPGTYSEGRIPVIVYRETVMVSLKVLEEVTDLQIETSGDAARIALFTRRLFCYAGSNTATYTRGNSGEKGVFEHRKFDLSEAPFIYDGEYYVPLADVTEILGLSPHTMESNETGQWYLGLARPRYNALDVMAAIYACPENFTVDYTMGDKSYQTQYSSSGVTSVVSDLLEAEPAAWLTYIKSCFCYDIWGDYMPWTDGDVGGLEDWERQMMDELYDAIVGAGVDESDAAMSKAVEEAGDVWSLFGDALAGIGKADMAVLGKQMKDLLKTKGLDQKAFMRHMDRMSLHRETWAQSGKVISWTGTGLEVISKLLEFGETLRFYDQREAMAVHAYGTLSDFSDDFLYLDQTCRRQIATEVKNNAKGKLTYALSEFLWNNSSEYAVKGAALLLDAKCPALLAYKLGTMLAPEYQAQLRSMRAFQVSVYALLLQQDAMAVFLDQAASGAEGRSPAELRTCMELAYITLKDAYVASRLMVLSGNSRNTTWSDDMAGMQKEYLDLLAIITNEYDEEDDEKLPLAIDDLIGEVSAINAKVLSVLTPLYAVVSGAVLDAGNNKEPVVDAEAAISINDKEGFTFSGTPGGRYDKINIPLEKPSQKVYDAVEGEGAGPYKVGIRFTSPTVEGEDTVTQTWTPRQPMEMEDALLGGVDYYRYIRDEMLPTAGYVSQAASSKTLSSDSAWQNLHWDERTGLLGADVVDLDGDDREDCLVYSIENEGQGTLFYATLLSYTPEKGIYEVEKRLLMRDLNVSYTLEYGGILEYGGKTYFYTEHNGNAYFADGYSNSYNFYTFDEDGFYRSFWVGKSDGGSSELAYSLVYENPDGTEKSKQVIAADDGYRYFYPAIPIILDTNYFGEAEIYGLVDLLGLPEPDLVYQADADYGILPKGRNYFPSYMENHDLVKPSFLYLCSGPGSYRSRNMSVRVTDHTDLKGHIEALED